MAFTPIVSAGPGLGIGAPLAVVWRGNAPTLPLLDAPTASPIVRPNRNVSIGALHDTVPVLYRSEGSLQAYRETETAALLAHARFFLAHDASAAIVVSGPSGAGKSHAIAQVVAQCESGSVEVHEFQALPAQGWQQSTRLAIIDLSNLHPEQMAALVEAKGIDAALAIVFYLQPLSDAQCREAKTARIPVVDVNGVGNLFRDPRPQQLQGGATIAVTDDSDPVLFTMATCRHRHPSARVEYITPHELAQFTEARAWFQRWHALVADDEQPLEEWFDFYIGAPRNFAPSAGLYPAWQIAAARLLTITALCMYYDEAAPWHRVACVSMDGAELRTLLQELGSGKVIYGQEWEPYLQTLAKTSEERGYI